MTHPMQCRVCGTTPRYSDAAYCPNCGAPLNQQPYQQPNAQPNQRPSNPYSGDPYPGSPYGSDPHGRNDPYSQHPDDSPTMAIGRVGPTGPPPPVVIPPDPPNNTRRNALIAVLALVVVAAAVVGIVFATTSSSPTADGGSTPPASPSASSSASGQSASSSTSSSPSSAPISSATPAPAAASSALVKTFQSATAVDPTPYTGAHPNLQFVTPSKNIYCQMVDENGTNSVTCTIAEYDFAQPGSDCDKGATAGFTHNGTPQYQGCATSAVNSGARVLAYGNSLSNGRIGCSSASAGVTCVDLDTGDGITVSRKTLRLVPGQTYSTPAKPACPSDATLAAAWDAAHAPTKSAGTSGIACSGGWAVAGVNDGQNTVTGVFRLMGTTWTWVDRAAPCQTHQVPAAIYSEACESN